MCAVHVWLAIMYPNRGKRFGWVWMGNWDGMGSWMGMGNWMGWEVGWGWGNWMGWKFRLACDAMQWVDGWVDGRPIHHARLCVLVSVCVPRRAHHVGGQVGVRRVGGQVGACAGEGKRTGSHVGSRRPDLTKKICVQRRRIRPMLAALPVQTCKSNSSSCLQSFVSALYRHRQRHVPLCWHGRAGTQNEPLDKSFPTARDTCPMHVYMPAHARV